MEEPGEVHGRDRLVIIDRVLRERLADVDPGVVDERVDPSEPGRASRASAGGRGWVAVRRAALRLALGTPFWAYASFWVRKAMQELVAELTRPVALSDRAARDLSRVRRARNEYL
jgi:hypothetical protein